MSAPEMKIAYNSSGLAYYVATGKLLKKPSEINATPSDTAQTTVVNYGTQQSLVRVVTPAKVIVGKANWVRLPKVVHVQPVGMRTKGDYQRL